MIGIEARQFAAIVEAVYEAIDIVGIEGVRAMSWFPSSGVGNAVADQELETA